jgi:hypothetical protein
MVSRKLLHLEKHLRDKAAEGMPLTPYEMRHVADILAAMRELVLQMELLRVDPEA